MTGSHTLFGRPSTDLSSITGGVTPEQSAKLPGDLVLIMKRFWGSLQIVRDSYAKADQGRLRIEQTTPDHYTREYMREQIMRFVDGVLKEQADALAVAKGRLEEAQQLINLKTRPIPGEADPVLWEMKLMNAREEVRMALEGVHADEIIPTLLDLIRENVISAPAIPYYLVYTDAYKRLIRDGAARLTYQDHYLPSLKRNLATPEALQYLDAQEAVESMVSAFEMAELSRGFAAMDHPEFNWTL
ncbi:hypothetical protein ACFQDE_21050 [Deinococcus caeni]|uniref:Uncharacterized protein n=1 Tax=Deinococcus caeni TaxID=569127 RepID=A0ABP9UF27_9DEIO